MNAPGRGQAVGGGQEPTLEGLHTEHRLRAHLAEVRGRGWTSPLTPAEEEQVDRLQEQAQQMMLARLPRRPSLDQAWDLIGHDGWIVALRIIAGCELVEELLAWLAWDLEDVPRVREVTVEGRPVQVLMPAVAVLWQEWAADVATRPRDWSERVQDRWTTVLALAAPETAGGREAHRVELRLLRDLGHHSPDALAALVDWAGWGDTKTTTGRYALTRPGRRELDPPAAPPWH